MQPRESRAVERGVMKTSPKRKPSNWFDEAVPKIGLTVICLIFLVSLNYSRWQGDSRVQFECVSNLAKLRAAVQRWAVEHQRVTGDTIVEAEVLPYLNGSRLPTCRGDGSYQLPRTVGELPTCSIPGHAIHQ